jgi:hypothetical protein
MFKKDRKLYNETVIKQINKSWLLFINFKIWNINYMFYDINISI